ncbi:O-methyltransferase [Chryseobacterium indoltheticum]|uniref:Cobalt-precorrin-6Y C(15)-methyltransferase n=1 Tax=Chryseobacterium indoltheticum TaxID=254 RepID=A0A381FQC9_9FLAO|nr:class I SAM-dependent methyltransferase [Chryseobacterium indoltheticum]SUX48764.1 cobalt-precorrin-6Y C(15)-methyltransferase [Chryseobacterium indoltheticum]
MNVLNKPAVQETLIELHQESDANNFQRSGILDKIQDPQERKIKHDELRKTTFMSVGRDEGKFLYISALSSRTKNIVEFGCSFGISTIYLAAAASQNGGSVTTTEMEPKKWDKAVKNISTAGLQNYVEILKGDALQTLQTYDKDIDLLFLDGEKSLYLPIFELLQKKFHTGTLIIADNVDKPELSEFVSMIMNNPEKYTAVKLFNDKILQILIQ